MNILKTNWPAFFKASAPIAALFAAGVFFSFFPEAIDYLIPGASLGLLLWFARNRYNELKERDAMM